METDPVRSGFPSVLFSKNPLRGGKRNLCFNTIHLEFCTTEHLCSNISYSWGDWRAILPNWEDETSQKLSCVNFEKLAHGANKKWSTRRQSSFFIIASPGWIFSHYYLSHSLLKIKKYKRHACTVIKCQSEGPLSPMEV